MTINVTTAPYLGAHNKKPMGYGLWFFSIGDGNGRWLSEYFTYTGKYSDAKKSAIAYARSRGLTEIALQP